MRERQTDTYRLQRPNRGGIGILCEAKAQEESQKLRNERTWNARNLHYLAARPSRTSMREIGLHQTWRQVIGISCILMYRIQSEDSLSESWESCKVSEGKAHSYWESYAPSLVDITRPASISEEKGFNSNKLLW